MASEQRVRQNFIVGVVDNNPLASGGTTLNSSALASLEAIDSAEHAVIILDPDGAGNGPEVVHVTAHTGGATSATIVRAREGTSAVEHAQNTDWVHGPTEADFPGSISSSADRPASGGLPYPGQLKYEVDLHRWVYYDHDAALWLPAAGLMPAFRLGRTSSQTIPEGAWTAIAWNSEGFDTDGMHSGSDTTVTINTPGLWHFEGFAEFAPNSDATSPRGVRIRASDGQTAGGNMSAENTSALFVSAPSCSGLLSLAAGATVELQAYHHGSDLGLNLGNFITEAALYAVFCGHWVGPAA